ncbi:MAG: SRPBCC family protein [Hyphomicrobiaceae bacterium]|nr:SRPBCC family protein [Hyphomicrobiaceae bacterium]MCC0025063.1 SRPBCC family protein [Hyphomicrobiaceae bacterium]
MSPENSNKSDEQSQVSIEREGDCELVVTRTFDAPPGTVYRAWSQAELFRRWWVPKSAPGISLVACELDVRTGGKYRLEFSAGGAETMAFYGKYLEVVPNERIVWTNDEGEEGAVTTVIFEDRGGKTLLTFREVYPSKEALDEALQGSAVALPEQLEQLGQLLADMDR